MSASQDVVIDAYRTDLLPRAERGMGASLAVGGYRLAMILSGGIALIWTDAQQGGGWSWPEVYRLMAGLMVVAAAVCRRRCCPAGRAPGRAGNGRGDRNDLLGFLAVVAAVVVGYAFTDLVVAPAVRTLMAPLWQGSALGTACRGAGPTWWRCCWASPSRCRWRRGRRGARASRPCCRACATTSASAGAAAFLLFIVLYKLGDAFAGSLMTPFLLKSMAFSPAEVGVVNKVIGLWLTIGGALVGGALMFKLGLWRALADLRRAADGQQSGLLVAGGEWQGPDAGPGDPAFDWGFVKLAAPTPVDGGLLMVIAFENLSGGMGTAAFLAFLMSLCNQRFTATQFALLSAFASVGRVWVGPLAGVLAESIGWPAFFIVSTVAACRRWRCSGGCARACARSRLEARLGGPADDRIRFPHRCRAGCAAWHRLFVCAAHAAPVHRRCWPVVRRRRCRRWRNSRRRPTAACAATWARRASFTKLVSAEQVERPRRSSTRR